MAGIDRRLERAAATGTHGINARPRRAATDGVGFRSGQRDAAALRSGGCGRGADHARDRAVVAADNLQLHHPAAFDEAGGRGRTIRGPAMSRIAILLAVSAMSAASVRAQEPASALPERRALPNPTVSYGRFTPSGGARTLFDGSQQQQATVDLPLLIGGQRGARIEAAEQGLLAARARVGLAGNELALRAADLFVVLQAAQEKASMLDESVAEIKRVVTIVSGRLDSGAASRYDLTRVEVELAGMNARLADARAELSDRSAGLAALLGPSGWRP